MSRFRRGKAGVTLSLDPVEAAVLAQVINEVFELVGPLPQQDDDAAWAREFGLSGLGDSSADPEPPNDPIRARLFPDAYRDDDEAARDFRRFTESELRSAKAAHAQTLLRTIPEGGGSVVLDEDASAAWLGALNDARLALGTALDVDENTTYELATLEASEPRAQRLYVYVWLGELQDSLLSALSGE